MANYVLPQVLVYQELTTIPTPILAPLRAMIMGPNYDLKRYNVAAEKALIGLGAYDPATDASFNWPDRPAGGIVDQAWTRLFMDEAWLNYWSNTTQIRKSATYANRIRATAVNFVTYSAWARDASLYSRDVQLGDGVRVVRGAVEVETYVTGFIHDQVASSIGAATADTSNQANTVFNQTISQTVGPFNDVQGTPDGSLYDGMADGHVQETYVVTVLQGSTGGDALTARLSVVSASGTDNVSSVVPAAFGAATDIGTRGMKVTFDWAPSWSSSSLAPTLSSSSLSSQSSMSAGPHGLGNDFVAGQQWTVTVRQTYTKPTPSDAGTYTGPADSTYIVTILVGGDYASNPTFMVTTNNGTDASGPHTITGSGDQIQCGNYGVTIGFTGGTGVVAGDRFTIAVVATKDGAVKTLILANSLPASMDAVDLSVDLYIRKNIEVTENRTGFAPLVNWETSATQFTTKAGIIAYDASWYNGSGVLMAMDVYQGSMYVQYRSLLQTYATYVHTISDVSFIESDIGPISVDNPLALGIFKALSNSNGTDVKYMACPTDDTAGYSYILQQCVGRNDVYGFVPLTWDRTIQNLVAAHVSGMSSAENGRWRLAWTNSEAEEIAAIAIANPDGSTSMATVTDPALGTNYTFVYWADGQFLTDGVKAGDIYRTNYQSDGFGNWTYEEYVVDTVISEDSLTLLTGPSAALNIPVKFEVWRDLTKDEIATAYGVVSGSFASRRVRHVWPDWIGSAGTTMQGYYLCAALAGLRSGVAAQQGLTNLEIAGFDDVSRSTDFFGGNQLNIMAAAGTWVVTQDTDTGQVYTRHQLTTADYGDLNQREDSITTNLDSISYYLLAAFAPYIGKANISPSFLSQLYTDLSARLNDLKIEYVPRLGPQIIAWEITDFRQHSVLRDRVVATVLLTVPYPFNNFEIHLVI